MSAITPRGLEINPDAARPFEAILVARTLLRTSRTAALATMDPGGYPYSTVTNLAVEPDGTAFFFTAGLALQARNIDHDARISLTVAEASSDVMTTPRLTLVGRAVAVPAQEMDALKRAYTARYPKAKLYLSLPDTRLYRLAVDGVHINGGPARNANSVTPQDLLTDLSDAGELMAGTEEIIAKLNDDDHAAGLAARAGAGLARWRVTGIDPDGVDLASSDALARLWFPMPVKTRAEFLAALSAVEA